MYPNVTLTPDDPQSGLLQVGAAITSSEIGLRLTQPCGALHDRRCAVYDERPSLCRSYRCDLLKATEAGKVSTGEAKRTIAVAIRLRDEIRHLLQQDTETTDERSLESLRERLREGFESANDQAAFQRQHAELFARLADIQHHLHSHFEKTAPSPASP